ncbi:MAG: methylenetetrahydrofolate--tRNA-(uracil(54)-C(5))-methyltransferase (FADH(2)-oxidizing) TrmFO [Clostridia bacterium]|nr:methylenetetrahydrofolate--tRNA-(uracil(54)-C(5))-methyltransferase (FADH(2)-oxidizing) TrmFO [Clostridia bacterium]
MEQHITVIGAGLAGCEAAWQAAGAGVQVTLYEMKPAKRTPAHTTDLFAELVCSNSFKASRIDSAAGLMKEEMRRLGSLLLEAADCCKVPAGGALAVDRDDFAAYVTEKVKNHPNIKCVSEEVCDIPAKGIAVIATGPLTSEPLSKSIQRLCGEEYLSFFDAAAPIVTAESVDMSKAFFASRYDKGGDDAYINCPMNKEQYEIFYSELVKAETAPLHEFDNGGAVYEGCMPVEVLAKRGEDTLRFGALKPVGLRDPETGRRPWAVVQLRRENAQGTLYNLVGFQTNLKFGEQRRVFGLIPALENAEFMRYGVMHRNTFINSTRLLGADYSLKKDNRIFFAGQITGVEGYMESAGAGIIAGINAVRRAQGKPTVTLPKTTVLGALAGYISDPYVTDFQPMGANFGVLPPIEPHIRDKKQRYAALSQRALSELELFIKEMQYI